MYRPECDILAMIQPSPLPGSYRYEGQPLGGIVDQALAETEMVYKCGFDGIIIQNMNDMPIKQYSRPEAIAYMTLLTREIRRSFPHMVIGVLMNWDGVAGLSAADAGGADFVRVEHLFTGAEVTSAGLLQAQCVEIAELRKRIRSQVAVYADIYEVHGVPLGAKSIEEAAWEAVHEGFADGLFLSGRTKEESLEFIRRVRTRIPDSPILLGGGATGHNVGELLKAYDGVSVATWIKNGDMKNPIDLSRAGAFVKEAGKAKQLRKGKIANGKNVGDGGHM